MFVTSVRKLLLFPYYSALPVSQLEWWLGQSSGYFTYFPVKVATLLSVIQHSPRFHSCSDLHNLSRRSQDLLLKYVCRGRCRCAHTHRNISSSVWLAHYIAVRSQMHVLICFSSAVCSERHTDKALFLSSLFLLLLLYIIIPWGHLHVWTICISVHVWAFGLVLSRPLCTIKQTNI